MITFGFGDLHGESKEAERFPSSSSSLALHHHHHHQFSHLSCLVFFCPSSSPLPLSAAVIVDLTLAAQFVTKGVQASKQAVGHVDTDTLKYRSGGAEIEEGGRLLRVEREEAGHRITGTTVQSALLPLLLLKEYPSCIVRTQLLQRAVGTKSG